MSDLYYRSDLAYIHDAGFGDFARQAGSQLLALLSPGPKHEQQAVDLGCGSGIWARMLVDAGYSVLGIDLSPEMVAHARARVPEATFHVGSFLDMDFPRCHLVTSMGECLNYLFDSANNLDALSDLFHRIYEALHPGGLFAFDVIGPGYQKATGPPKRFMLGDDWAVLVSIEENVDHATLDRHITSFRKVGDSYKRDDEIHQVRLYTGTQLTAVLKALGFTVSVSRGYGKYTLSDAHSVVIAKKPGS